MRFKLLSIILLLFFFVHSNLLAQKRKAPAQDKSSIVGNWETVPIHLESSSLKLDFNKNGSFSYHLTSVWGGSYKLNGTQMVTTYYIPILNKTRTDTSTVLIYADTLVQVSNVNGKVKTLKMVRENHKAMKGAGIIGRWILENSDAESATMTYTPEGKFELNKVLRSFNGNFVVNKDTVSVYSNGIPMMKSHFLLERGKLLLYSSAKSGYVKLQRIKK